MSGQEFRTLKGYQLKNNKAVTEAMEDYLEMIYRMLMTQGDVRIGNLAERLNVKPSSCSEMVGNLKGMGLVEYEKYGIVQLTPEGERLGKYLLYRHKVLHEFLCFVNQTENELEQTEQLEHYVQKRTVENLERLLRQWNQGG
ncbi:metal-dependent transcriptional regulator [Clostridium minihomine]|uniref:metal-dependent transcriptional regulator n=1 Tax=Clostridium minihomine TaxID=2045012 RepID=UPI000C769FBF|nr:metal-dependent transcriptional regulator [Clostridium minihomine]